MDNPIRTLRATAGLKRADFAAQLRVSYLDIAYAELGYFRRLPPRIMKALEAAGYDSSAVQASYIESRPPRPRLGTYVVAERPSSTPA